MLSIPKYPEQYAQHFPTIFYLLCCASQHHVAVLSLGLVLIFGAGVYVVQKELVADYAGKRFVPAGAAENDVINAGTETSRPPLPAM